MDKTTVGNLCKPYVGQLKLDGDTLIDYFDIASVDNIEKQITGYTTYTFSEAPSRARKQIKKGNILVSTVRPNLNAVALFDKETENTPVVSTGFCVLECKADTSPQFLFRYLQSKSFVRAMVSQATGASYPAVSDKIVRDAQIPAYSYEEQIQIANVLDAAANIISKRKQQLQKLDELVKARFVEMFGDPMTNPKGFPCYTVGEVIDFQGGSQPDKIYFEYEPTPDNIRLIQIRDYKSDKYITYIPKSMAKRFCTADDIMIGRYGPPIFQILKGIEGSFNVALMKATPKMGNRAFVRQFLKQDCLLKYLEGLSKRTAGQDGIQMDKLKAYPFPYPPIELQNQFAAFVEQIDKSKAVVQKALDEAQLLFDSLMQKYFGQGETRDI